MAFKKSVLILLIFLLGLSVRLNNLTERSLWTDEFFTLFQSTGHGEQAIYFLEDIGRQRAPVFYGTSVFKKFLKNDPGKKLRDVTAGLFKTDTSPPLYYWIMNFWMKIFGDSVLAIRLFSVMMGLVCIGLVYRVACLLFNDDIAFFAALTFTLSAYAVRYSQEGRSYTAIMALCLMSSLFLLRFDKNGKRKDLLGFILMTIIGMYTHYFYSLVLCGQCAYFMAVNRKDPLVLKKWSGALAYGGVALIPWAWMVVQQRNNSNFGMWAFGHSGGILQKMGQAVIGIGRNYVLFSQRGRLEYFSFLTGFIFVGVAWFVLRKMKDRYLRSIVFCLSMGLIPIVLLLALDIARGGILLKQVRLWTFPCVGLILIGGCVLHYVFSKNKILAGCLFTAMGVASLHAATFQVGPAPRAVSSWINQESRGRGACVIVLNLRSITFGQAYYLKDALYLAPVLNEAQLDEAVKHIPSGIDRVFVISHGHSSENFLENKSFLTGKDARFIIGNGFYKDFVAAKEYVKGSSL